MAKIIVGISGGVDSSVAAYLLKQQGHEVIGVFMRNWDSLINNDIKGNKYDFDQCPQESDWADAQEVAKKLDIKIYRKDFISEYWDNVFTYFIEEYKNGRTPNPDILCNKYIKFDKFLNYALKEFNADFIAMGHYAKTENGKLYRAKDQNKDQTYFLAQLNNFQLSKTIFPLADLSKQEVREIASKLNLITAKKKDSTGICFIGDRNFTEFLQNYIPSQPGNILDIKTKKILGTHIGAMYYTLGQRKGLNLGGMSEPHFVVGHNIKNKEIYVAPASEKEWLISDELDALNLNLNEINFNNKNLSAKFRYRQNDIPVTIELLENNKIKVFYPQGAEAVTPGQQVVLYDGEKCLGGATIDKIYRKKKLITYV
ncbi:tRNA 2-thiouridine(34) synthase MnmA [Mesomycoplasma lagogenitalium]|uniref:tRNA-specific 2-thiouridylase MnmA n=1 Tax=Mesomycoplasma lagogenitalium TaxID=171286 RepID=A0ABY8LVI6_9BACT|nr:tRNA 2-thiouridine(34) synthase MnmA [Mesomycoplasma lagogenitalium]